MHYKFLVYCCCILNEWILTEKKKKRKLLAEMYSKHRKYSKSSNKFNKETRTYCKLYHRISLSYKRDHQNFACLILTSLTYIYTIYSHTAGHWWGFFYVPQEPDKLKCCETERTVFRPYPWGLESLTVCRRHNKRQRQHFLSQLF